MKTRAVGPQGSWVRGYGILLSIVIAFAADMVLVKTVLAVHDTGLFQLDGDAISSTFLPGFPANDDWDKVCHQVNPAACPSASNTTGAAAVSWTSETDPSASIFTGGGSKDPIDINQWAWKDQGGLPDKDNLLHAFASRYQKSMVGRTTPDPTCPNGTGPGTAYPTFDPTKPCDVLFFGSDRIDNSGDAQQGFWFFQNEISLASNSVGGGSGFSGVHKAGDLLIISDFSNGGTTSTITAYKWDPSCTATNKAINPTNPKKTIEDLNCGDANLRKIIDVPNARCDLGSASDGACGIVNPAVITMPWSFTDKSGTPSNGALNGEFYEGGINLSKLGLSGQCFASLGSETRSSTSTTAVLKDFILGAFAQCTAGLETTPSIGSQTIGTGIVDGLTDSARLNVGGAASWNGKLKFFLCAPNELSATTPSVCLTGGTQVILPGDDSTGHAISNIDSQPFISGTASVTSVGKYCYRSEFISATNGVPSAKDPDPTKPLTESECFFITPVTPTITTNAGAGPVLLGQPVNDTAHLNGTATQPGNPLVNGPQGSPAAGTITFTLKKADCTTNAEGTGTNPQTVSVSGNADYIASFIPNAVGTYYWVATYGGNSPNTNAGDVTLSACPDSNESVIVYDSTSVTSAQTWVPNDSGTVTATNGNTPLTGTLTIQLYESSSCSAGTEVAGQFYSKTLTNATTAAARTLTTTNSTYVVSVTKAVSWKVVFSTLDPTLTGNDHCETTSLTVVN